MQWGHHTRSAFQTTSWTQIVRARNGGQDLEALLERYWSPVYAYIRSSGKNQDDASDLTQAFLLSLLESNVLLNRADPERGRFRSYLKAALKRFLVDEHRRVHGRADQRAGVNKAAHQSRPKCVQVPVEMLESLEPRKRDDPHAAFERQWAAATMSLALARLEVSCRENGQADDWAVFESRVLLPAKQGTAPKPIEQVLQQSNAKTPQQVYSIIQTMKRRLHRELCAVVSESVEDPADIEGELSVLRSILTA